MLRYSTEAFFQIMGIKQIIQLESDAVTERAIKIPFDFTDKSSFPAGKNPGDHIVISPVTVRTWFRLKPLLLKIEKADIDKLAVQDGRDFSEDLPEIISKYDEVIMDIICLGIHNKKTDPPLWFREVLKDNCTWEDIHILLNAILFRIGYNPFCKSITIVKRVSPLNEQEIIALEKNMESWKQ